MLNNIANIGYSAKPAFCGKNVTKTSVFKFENGVKKEFLDYGNGHKRIIISQNDKAISIINLHPDGSLFVKNIKKGTYELCGKYAELIKIKKINSNNFIKRLLGLFK